MNLIIDLIQNNHFDAAIHIVASQFNEIPKGFARAIVDCIRANPNEFVSSDNSTELLKFKYNPIGVSKLSYMGISEDVIELMFDHIPPRVKPNIILGGVQFPSVDASNTVTVCDAIPALILETTKPSLCHYTDTLISCTDTSSSCDSSSSISCDF